MNVFIRCKLALTEENPKIKPYREDLWAELNDYSYENLDDSTSVLKGIHARWSELISGLNEERLKRTYHHSDERA